MDPLAWAKWVEVVKEAGTVGVLLGVIYALAFGRLFTEVSYRQMVTDRDEWKTAYRAVADFAIRQQQEARK